MSEPYNNRLYRKVSAKGFEPFHVAEVGVWHPKGSNVYRFIQAGIRTTLVEPDPESIRLIKDAFGQNANVTLHEVAACDSNGDIELCKRGSSTFVSTLSSSPALVNDACDVSQSVKFTARGQVFSEIDDGTIDLISVDTEGSEWFVIKHMRSRPRVVSIETHGGMYVNPYGKELLGWMREHDYVLWYKDKSDSIFVQKGRIPVSMTESFLLRYTNARIALRARRKRLKKRIQRLTGAHTGT